jgi:hypothetical protein
MSTAELIPTHVPWSMGNPMPESTLTLCQSRLYSPFRDFGFGLWVRSKEKRRGSTGKVIFVIPRGYRHTKPDNDHYRFFLLNDCLFPWSLYPARKAFSVRDTSVFWLGKERLSKWGVLYEQSFYFNLSPSLTLFVLYSRVL